MRFESVGAPLVRLVESASDELARLDALSAVAPIAVFEHLRLAALAQFGTSTEGTPFAHASLAAVAVDAVHAALLPSDVERWIRTVEVEERRARSGAPLTAARVLAWLPALSNANPANPANPADAANPTHQAGLAALDDALRPGGAPRAVLLRAVAAAATVRTRLAPRGTASDAAVAGAPTTAAAAAAAAATAERTAAAHAAADLLPALMLCAAGHTDRIRLLPFAELDAAAREEALAAWDEGDEAPFAQLALAECARAARATRQWVVAALAGIPAEDAKLDTLGRAAITARRALAALRQSVGATVPSLATALACSRPAAGDALDRLVELQLAHEITGRGRDRVFVWSAVHRPA